MNVDSVLGTIGRGRFTIPKLAHTLKLPRYLCKQVPAVMPPEGLRLPVRRRFFVSMTFGASRADTAKVAQIEVTGR